MESFLFSIIHYIPEMILEISIVQNVSAAWSVNVPWSNQAQSCPVKSIHLWWIKITVWFLHALDFRGAYL